MNVFDYNNEDVLKSQGWIPYKDSTLKSMTKDELIEYIRCLEHNWAGEIKACWLQSHRLVFTEQIFEDVIKDIKAYKPLYSELDYDSNDEPFLDYISLDIDYIIKNVLDNHNIDNPTQEELLFGTVGFLCRFLNHNDGWVYFSEEENKAIDKYIQEHSIEHKDNFFDYYKDEVNENDKEKE